MKALKYLLFLILIVIIGLAIYIAIQPNAFEVTRARTFKAPAAVIYNNVVDYKKWEAWSPWVEKEPDLKLTYPEQTKGIGGHYSWEGKDGLGRMKTLSTIENKSITQEIQFEDYTPSNILWTFEPTQDNQTKVTWTMKSDDVPFLFKGIAAFSGGFDKMIGPDFERGLEKLDSLTTKAVEQYTITVNGVTEHGGGFYIYNTTSCKMDQLEPTVQNMMNTINTYAAKNNILRAGAPYVRYHKWDKQNNAVMFSCCVPTTARVDTAASDILTGQLAPFKAVETTLKGNYTNLKEAWDTAMAYVTERNLEFAETGPMIETYVTDPTSEPNPAKWITKIYIAVK